MNIIQKTKQLFLVENVTIDERILICEITFNTKSSNLPSYDKILDFFNNVYFENKVTISFSSYDDILFLENTNIEKEQAYIKYLSNLDTDDIIEIRIEIEKNTKNNSVTIYNYKVFTNSLLGSSIYDIMQIFSGLLDNKDYIIFHVLDEPIYWNTKTLLFTNNTNSSFSPSVNRAYRLKSSKTVSYFKEYLNLKILPDDFEIRANTIDNLYEETFSRIRTILSISYISSLSSIENNILHCTINGQKTLSYSYKLNEIKNNNTLYKVYDWIYTDGNSSDKAIIARNILSLHCRFCELSDIDMKTFTSIISNYGLYLKDNASEYLEAKAKLSEFICDIGTKAGDSALNLLNGFKSNIIAIFGFILSVALVNIVSENPLDNILTKEITMILELILFGSIIYYIFCLFETIYKYNKIKVSYLSLRNNYKDIFIEEELNNIFENNNLFTNLKKSIINNSILLSIIWVLFIIIAIVIIEIISTSPFIYPTIQKLFTLIYHLPNHSL